MSINGMRNGGKSENGGNLPKGSKAKKMVRSVLTWVAGKVAWEWVKALFQDGSWFFDL